MTRRRAHPVVQPLPQGPARTLAAHRLGGAPARLLGLLLLIALAATGLTTLLATPAAAHTELVSTDPAEGSTVAGPPSSVTLTFSDPVQSDYVQVAVLDPAGTDVAAGDPQVVGDTVTQAVDAAADGGYTVAYRVFAADGHAISGELAFTVAAAAPPGAAAAPAQPAQPAEPAAPADEADAAAVVTGSQEADDGASPWLWAAMGGAALVGASVAAVAVRRVQRDAGDGRTSTTTGPATDRQPADRPH